LFIPKTYLRFVPGYNATDLEIGYAEISNTNPTYADDLPCLAKMLKVVRE
jgi:hypothetical protein